ncbi:MAG: recombinase zinc beta ribbon domain-containing protein, partial [Deltaproteobacteria bacterium]|nr:recombinase zinc beta ribbon domain-containing protein [Deltaproteobacteria bacterium]
VDVPQVFTKVQFAKLRDCINENRNGNPIRNRENDPFLLRGKIRCGVCGKNYGCRMSRCSASYNYINYYVCWGRAVVKKHRGPEEKKCTAPIVNAKVLDHVIWERLIFKLIIDPEKTLAEWGAVSSSKKTHIITLDKKIEKINRDINKQDHAMERLLSNVIHMNFPEDKIKTEMDRIKMAVLTLEKEKNRIEIEKAKLQNIQNNNEALEECKSEIEGLEMTIVKKLREMPMTERKKLINNIIPKGSFIEIMPMDNNKSEYYKLEGMQRRSKINWNYSYQGIFDLRAVVKALKEYDERGIISDVPICHKLMTVDTIDTAHGSYLSYVENGL